MTIKLQTLTLRNFKGIRYLMLTPNGHDASIYGPNGAGKTTSWTPFSCRTIVTQKGVALQSNEMICRYELGGGAE